LRFSQKELDMFIPDDVVGMEVHHFSNGNGRVWVCRRRDCLATKAQPQRS